MSSTAASSNPCLVAILLITQARAGDSAQVTFHYPPEPFKHDETKAQHEEAASEASSSDSDSDSSSDDSPFELLSPQAKTNGNPIAVALKSYKGSDALKVGPPGIDAEWKPPWDPLLGLGEENLVSLLAPGRTWHKRKFEMGINDLTFIGRPVYARDNGTWARRKRKKSQKKPPHESDAVSDQTSESGLEEEDKLAMSPRRFTDETAPQKSLTMYHLVFVLNPPSLEQVIRVKEMYDHVAKRLSKILKLEQAKSNYVREQSELIQRLRGACFTSKTSTDTYYSQVTKQSTLANAIAVTFRTISQSRVAAVVLSSKKVSISMQIPPVTSTSYLPSLTEPPIKPGLWLTTANDAPTTNSDLDAAVSSSALQLAKHFTLLLQESPQKILKELQETNGPLVLALTSFLDKLKSTKSFYKISVASKISLADIQLLARHLIYWRRAVAITPLHHRDTYIVSPNADMSKLVQASKSFEASFPMLPSLPKLLALMSQTPTPYGMLIPSSDHKEEYYRVLAWLMRGGWVTQLRTFAYVRVDPRVKRAVREKDRELHNRMRLEKLDIAKEQPSIAEYISSTKRPSIASTPSSDGRQSVNSNKPSHNPNAASIIVSPLRASGDESKWLAHIADSLLSEEYSDQTLSQEEKQELKAYWNVLVKYFNGLEALEKVPMREGLKRKFVWDLLGRMGLNFDRGVPDEKEDNKSVIVTVRHW